MDRDKKPFHKRGKYMKKRLRSPARHPPHLKGREIGLFYAKRNTEKREALGIERTPRPILPVDELAVPPTKLAQLAEELEEGEQIMSDLIKNVYYQGNRKFKELFQKNISGSMDDKLNSFIETTKQDTQLDGQLFRDLNNKLQSEKYVSMLEFRKKLPAYKMKDEILNIIGQNQVCVISGDTGCGKTTQVAQFILDDYIEKQKGSLCHILCSQPRRISAISVADRVSQERAEPLGQSAGYHIRLESKPPRDKGSITFCTTGIILRKMATDPCLKGTSHLILDEIHERDIMTDFIMALIKQVIKKRKNLKVILMSATLNSEQFAKYFGDCAICSIPGFTFSVESYFLEDAIEQTNFQYDCGRNRKSNWFNNRWHGTDYKNYIEPFVRDLESCGKYSRNTCIQLRNPSSEEVNLDLILALIQHICHHDQTNSAILVFLTGYMDITRLNDLLEISRKFPRHKYLIIPLHSLMPTTEQRQVFERPPSGKRKIILSTQIAETSITIDDVVFVIDCGKIKISNFDTEQNSETLLPQWVAQANALQRRGRAGRVQEGVCYHLVTKARYNLLEQYQKPEILRTRLENVILQIKLLQLGKAEDFLKSLMDVPNDDQIQISLELLKRMNALDSEEVLTPLGYHLAQLPVAPQMGKMLILGALFGCIDPISSIAASLDFKDAFQLPLGKEQEAQAARMELSNNHQSDHLTLHEAIRRFEETDDKRRFCWKYFISYSTIKLLVNMKGQFVQYLNEMNFLPDKNPKNEMCNKNSDNVALVKAIICAGLYPNIGIIKSYGKVVRKVKLMTGKTASFHPKSICKNIRNFDSNLVAYYLKVKSTDDFIHDATAINTFPVVFFGDNMEYLEEEGLLTISQTLRFKCSKEIASIMEQLRNQLNEFLKYKATNPGVVDWYNLSSEAKVLLPILDIITEEAEGTIYDID